MWKGDVYPLSARVLALLIVGTVMIWGGVPAVCGMLTFAALHQAAWRLKYGRWMSVHDDFV